MGLKISLVLMGGRVEGLACADPEARTPIGTSGNFHVLIISNAAVIGWTISKVQMNFALKATYII